MRIKLVDFPIPFFVFCLAVLWLSAKAGTYLRRKQHGLEEGEREDLAVILGAALTLLALIIGFSFSMAVSRYDQRKNYEEAEANAIGTEYVRTGLLPAAHAAKVRELLKSYADQRVLFYTTRSPRRLEQVNAATSRLQADLWNAIEGVAATQPTPVLNLAITGMNDVLNSQGYAQAAAWNRIPTAAWALMLSIAVCCNVLVGYNARSSGRRRRWFFVLPVIVSIAFFLIADMDSPRTGVIRVTPENLIYLANSLRSQ